MTASLLGIPPAFVGKVAGDLHALLKDLTRRVIGSELEISRGAVANQLIGTRIRLLEHERRVKELEELEERLSALERSQGNERGGYGWAR